MVWAAGQKLQRGKYVIEKQLGRGGFGVTYLARDKKGNPVVIKTLKDEVFTYPELELFRYKFQQDFRDEALRLSLCRHPHIVKIDNTFNEGKMPCIVMEYIEGEDLWEYVSRKGMLSETEALKYIRQIGSALTMIHEKGLLHRDVKPPNIMLREGKSEAVLIDFGIAREFLPELTQTQTQMFSHGFAPIEQYAEQARRGEYTDVYALAGTLYYLLTLQVPTPAPARAARIPLNPPQLYNAKISETLNKAIMRGLEFEPEARPLTIPDWLALFEDDLSSAVGIDYTQLRDFLAAGKWQAADEATEILMLKAAGREKDSWLTDEALQQIPCQDLRTIDQLWMKYSNKRFGFTVQKQLWQSEKNHQDADWEIWSRFCQLVGWRVNGNWVVYHHLNFTSNAPTGHFPHKVGLGSYVGLRVERVSWISSLVSKLTDCKIQ